MLEPEVVLFDEPNSGLDPLTSDTIDDLIGRMQIEKSLNVDLAFLLKLRDEGRAAQEAETWRALPSS